ncbi:MAG TPA: hypothetical protein DCZ20_10285 [Lachnospiraceae bacterium]|nr:hypothetical protein [Lachnospiraceae bacterium]
MQKKTVCENVCGLFVTLFRKIHIMVVNQGNASGGALCGAHPAIFARAYHAEKREIHYVSE